MGAFRQRVHDATNDTKGDDPLLLACAEALMERWADEPYRLGLEVRGIDPRTIAQAVLRAALAVPPKLEPARCEHWDGDCQNLLEPDPRRLNEVDGRALCPACLADVDEHGPPWDRGSASSDPWADRPR